MSGAREEALGRRGWALSLLVGVTQIIGWGTTFFSPAVLAGPMARDLGLPLEWVFAGPTTMLLVGAVLGAPAGRYTDRHGARGAMCLGSLLLALALALLARAEGWAGFFLAWVVLGLAYPIALSQTAAAALARLTGRAARRSIAVMALVNSLGPTLAWLLGSVLEARYGWRATLLGYAALHLLVCLPIHALALRGTAPATPPPARVRGEPRAALPPGRLRLMVLTSLALSLAGFVAWGLPLQTLAILRGMGHAEAFALLASAVYGPAQFVARGGEMLFGRGIPIMALGLLSTGALVMAQLVALAFGWTAAGALAFSVVFGIGAGAFAVVRLVTPLHLFGARDFGAVSGLLGVPQNLAFALAPLLFGAAMGALGPMGPPLLALLVAGGAFAAMAALARASRAAQH